MAKKQADQTPGKNQAEPAAPDAEAEDAQPAPDEAPGAADAKAAPESDGGDIPGADQMGIEGIMAEIERQEGAEAAASVVATLEAERDEMKDRMLRALAEAENVRRRAERDRKDAETYGGTRLARDLLAVHDNLDRALSHVDDDMREAAKSFIEGVELTQRELLNAFAKHKIEKVSPPVGEKFNPNLHQAMFEAPIPGATPGAVIEVIQAGFTISDRLLRPALVGVAKAAPAPEKTNEADSEKTANDAPNGDTVEPEGKD